MGMIKRATAAALEPDLEVASIRRQGGMRLGLMMSNCWACNKLPSSPLSAGQLGRWVGAGGIRGQ